MSKQHITAEQLRELLDFDPSTGLFQWKSKNKRSHKAGWFGGSKNQRGYLNIQVCGVLYQSHRLAWLHVHGVWPDMVIDHINRIQTDNRIENLRDVSYSVNLRNRRKFVTKNSRAQDSAPQMEQI